MRKRIFHDELEDEGGLVNLTPLIDVVFVVLITFIIIAPLLRLDKVALAPGGSERESVSPQSKSEIVIHVYRDDTIALNEEKIRLSELSPKLQELHSASPHVIPKVFQDEKATFGSYQRVKNALELVGYEEMDVILKPIN